MNDCEVILQILRVQQRHDQVHQQTGSHHGTNYIKRVHCRSPSLSQPMAKAQVTSRNMPIAPIKTMSIITPMQVCFDGFSLARTG
jgi:hypothetical protein